MNGFGAGVEDLASRRLAERQAEASRAAAPYLTGSGFSAEQRGRAGAVLSRFASVLDGSSREKLAAVAFGGPGTRLRKEADALEARARALRDRAGPAGPDFGGAA